ncbi:Ephrin type-A receptor 2 [Clarias magur]|uniref:Ephrin type-A receptor 2 n=1 Tax=Clarias magur TaxID=1594786 RepID=A0A8J4XDH7_CLAMG|nr:Ephrin type-A receptor 2 [Clarias magur]
MPRGDSLMWCESRSCSLQAAIRPYQSYRDPKLITLRMRDTPTDQRLTSLNEPNMQKARGKVSMSRTDRTCPYSPEIRKVLLDMMASGGELCWLTWPDEDVVINRRKEKVCCEKGNIPSALGV